VKYLAALTLVLEYRPDLVPVGRKATALLVLIAALQDSVLRKMLAVATHQEAVMVVVVVVVVVVAMTAALHAAMGVVAAVSAAPQLRRRERSHVTRLCTAQRVILHIIVLMTVNVMQKWSNRPVKTQTPLKLGI